MKFIKMILICSFFVAVKKARFVGIQGKDLNYLGNGKIVEKKWIE